MDATSASLAPPLVEAIACWYLWGRWPWVNTNGIPFWLVGEFTTHFRRDLSGWSGMFTGGTIWVFTHSHLGEPSFRIIPGFLNGGAVFPGMGSTVDAKSISHHSEPLERLDSQRKYQPTSWLSTSWFPFMVRFLGLASIPRCKLCID